MVSNPEANGRMHGIESGINSSKPLSHWNRFVTSMAGPSEIDKCGCTCNYMLYLMKFINSTLTVMFGIKMIEKLPLQIFAVDWESTDPTNENYLIEFNGADEILFTLIGAFFVPSIILMIIASIYACGTSQSTSDYVNLIEEFKLKNNENEKAHSHHLLVKQASMEISRDDENYQRLIDQVSKIAGEKHDFLKIIIVFSLFSTICLFSGRFGVVISGVLSTNTELWLVCFGFSGFLMKLISVFVQTQMYLADQAIRSKDYFQSLAVYSGFNIAQLLTMGLLSHALLQAFGNFVDISWRGDSAWYVSLCV